jgi:hypothetical protein
VSYPHETNSSFNGGCKAPTNSGELSPQATPEMLAALRQIAEAEGRQFQVVFDEAMREYIDRRQKVSPRTHVTTSFAASLAEFDRLYRELAK